MQDSEHRQHDHQERETHETIITSKIVESAEVNRINHG